jgi:hypothetical protein
MSSKEQGINRRDFIKRAAGGVAIGIGAGDFYLNVESAEVIENKYARPSTEALQESDKRVRDLTNKEASGIILIPEERGSLEQGRQIQKLENDYKTNVSRDYLVNAARCVLDASLMTGGYIAARGRQWVDLFVEFKTKK